MSVRQYEGLEGSDEDCYYYSRWEQTAVTASHPRPFQKVAPEPDQPRERDVSRARAMRRHPRELGGGGKCQRDLLAQLGRGEGAVQEGRSMLRRYTVPTNRRRARDADTTAMQHPHIHPGLFRDARRLEAAPLERHGGALDAPLERVRTVPRLPARTTSLTSSDTWPSRIMCP